MASALFQPGYSEFVKPIQREFPYASPFEDILYIEGLRNYVQFVCKEEKVISLQNMKALEEELPAKQFIRIHKSYIINLDQIQQVEGNAVNIQGKILPIGQSYRTPFFNRIK